MVSRNVPVIEVNARILGLAIQPALRAGGLSKAAENRITVKTREALRKVLQDTVRTAFADGAIRSGNARNIMRAGVRVFGSRNISSLRGHVLGPEYILAQENGAKIVPKSARALAVPLAPAAVRPDGTPKLPGPRSWKNIKNTFIWKSRKTGKAYIVYREGAQMVFLYILLDEVELSKNKGFLSDALAIHQPDVVAAFSNAFRLEMATGAPSLGQRAGLSKKYDRRRRGRR